MLTDIDKRQKFIDEKRQRIRNKEVERLSYYSTVYNSIVTLYEPNKIYKGKIKQICKYDYGTGYGHIRCIDDDTKPDVYFTSDNIKDYSFNELIEGDNVEYTAQVTKTQNHENKYNAIYITIMQ